MAAGYPRVDIKLRYGNGKDQSFYARTHAWVSLSSLQKFVTALESVERERRGAARLESMSPGEFILIIEVFSPAGHVMAHGQTGRHIYRRNQDLLWVCLPYEIVFDPTQLPSMLREFRGLSQE
jgi:hypothetical protein